MFILFVSIAEYPRCKKFEGGFFSLNSVFPDLIETPFFRSLLQSISLSTDSGISTQKVDPPRVGAQDNSGS